jgi:hypothetical protein
MRQKDSTVLKIARLAFPPPKDADVASEPGNFFPMSGLRENVRNFGSQFIGSLIIVLMIGVACIWLRIGSSVLTIGRIPKELHIKEEFVGEQHLRIIVPIPSSQPVTVIGARKSCDCVMVPHLPWSNGH